MKGVFWLRLILAIVFCLAGVALFVLGVREKDLVLILSSVVLFFGVHLVTDE